jgi:hydrogenase expression/formation protein HypE
MRLEAGKLPPALLAKLLAGLPRPDASVVVAAAPGEDAAVIDTGGPELLVAKTDPITLAAAGAGRLLVAVNGNDLATMGAEPRWLMATALLPGGIDSVEVERIFEELKNACAEAGIALIGGHTEMTVGLDRPVLVGCLLGTVAREGLLRTADAREGDALLLAGGLAIEGAAILAREHREALAARGIDDGIAGAAAARLEAPGISVLPAARALRAGTGVHAMHDPTEGGLISALHELAGAAGAGLRVHRDAIPVLPETRAICAALGLDPLRLLASGALLAAVDPAAAAGALARLQAAGIPAAVIGEILPGPAGRMWDDGTPLPAAGRDELARYLESL